MHPLRVAMITAVAAFTAGLALPATARAGDVPLPASPADPTSPVDDPALVAALAEARGSGGENGISEIAVEILHDGNDAALTRTVAALGGEVTGSAPGSVLQVSVPAAHVDDLALSPGVTYVRSPRRVDVRPSGAAGLPNAGPISAEATTITNASAWQTAGFRGAGVKIGVIDYFNPTKWNAEVANGEVPAASGTFCRDTLPDGYDDCPGGSIFDITEEGHGNAVSEIIHDLAPDAQLYLGRGSTISDMYAVIDWFAANGVRIVNRSLGSPYDGPGDGTGELDALADYAVTNGITIINSAGNEGSDQYWRGSWIDTDGDGWMEFGPGDETLDIDTISSGGCVDILGFRWSDWGPLSSRTDYDVYLYDGNIQTYPDAAGSPNQQAGAPPIEADGVSGCPGAGVNLRVRKRSAGSGTAGDVLELLVYSGELEYSQSPYSAGTPIVDSRNRGVVAIGAVDPAASGSLGFYSSQGPTNDGRMKPDLSAPSGISTTVYGAEGFRGTSAAAPVAAGIAAVLLSANVAATPQGLAAMLKHQTIDRGAIGPDSEFGWGELRLGAPPTGTLDTSPAAYTPITPARLLDTRSARSRLLPEQIVDVPVSALVPANATAVALNVTVVGADLASYAQVLPTLRAPVDGSSNVNLEHVGQILPNFVITPIGVNRSVSVYSPAGGDLLIDVLGYFVPSEATAAGRLVPLDPYRVLDTRQATFGARRPAAGETVTVSFPAASGLPASGASAVVLTVTGTEPAHDGYVTAYPGHPGQARPEVSVLNLTKGTTNANTVIVPLAADGTVKLFTEQGSHLIVDLAGYLTSSATPISGSGRFVPVAPARVSDSRTGAPYTPAAGQAVFVGGRGGIPANGVAAASFNFTAIDGQGTHGGYLQVWPMGGSLSTEFSNLNWSRPGQTIASGGIVKLAWAGTIVVQSSQVTHVAVDVNGYFTS